MLNKKFFNFCTMFWTSNKAWGLKHGSSDGRAGNSRSKGPSFNPCLDPMRLCFKIYSWFVSKNHGWWPGRLKWLYANLNFLHLTCRICLSVGDLFYLPHFVSRPEICALDDWVQKRVCWPLCYTASPVEQ